ncbi:MAG: 16S rRNA (guanine(966)-N(2))-methyltransferase RsmD [Alphaproteobacteria bacterium]|nr:16S rRNA (guanine(966)-N(2))-methyltransferase RsmD [Alphaproteobacteria bacterium]
MRIIGGTLSGRKLKTPEGRATRPMMDRVREGLFNILAHHDWGKAIGDPLDGTNVLDAFCGTGALAFEALSRGAAQAFLFDKNKQARQTAAANAASLGLKDVCKIMPADATSPPKAEAPCQLVFLAPPYRKGLVPPALAALEKAGWIAPDALIVIETAKNEKLELPEKYAVLTERTYGDTALVFTSAAR